MVIKFASIGARSTKFAFDIVKRGKSDIIVRNSTREAIISQGPTGRQAWNGQTATVFGCTGFLGRYVVTQMAREGTRVVIPYRGISEHVRHLKPTGDLGMIIPMEFDLRNRKQLEECMAHSDVVVNLIGRNFETKNFTHEMVHIDGPIRIAEVAKDVGVARLIHVSRLGVDSSSSSSILSTKAKGERYLRENFPETTIVRPATMFGYEDELLTNIGYWKTNFLTVKQATNIMRPVNVEDVAKAIGQMRQNEWTAGKVFELYNPNEYTQQEIINLCSMVLREKVNAIDVPQGLLRLAARMIDILPYHYTSHHEVDLMGLDEIPTESSPENEIFTFEDLGIIPQTLEETAIRYLRHYRHFENENKPMELNARAFRK
ncbi:hypothetical protein BB559_003767 [Furculomyces boomerangus]|uniref:NAD(P)-binding domain-containing protein n=2 Tax=Harpellales TaxID=61421 RepID=A0A2T9YIT6_9FUNG|nr:hypothetical protein BB559_006538 [Furculomyces boomerangus]PVU92266.1 hypothetical protein BB559_003767 [Furculomyces boomerangus]PWA00646.1 hypothetical protein BB558_003300 [Smittium angustum]